MVAKENHREIVKRRRKRESEGAHKGFGFWACAVLGCGLERAGTMGKESTTPQYASLFCAFIHSFPPFFQSNSLSIAACASKSLTARHLWPCT